MGYCWGWCCAVEYPLVDLSKIVTATGVLVWQNTINGIPRDLQVVDSDLVLQAGDATRVASADGTIDWTQADGYDVPFYDNGNADHVFVIGASKIHKVVKATGVEVIEDGWPEPLTGTPAWVTHDLDERVFASSYGDSGTTLARIQDRTQADVEYDRVIKGFGTFALQHLKCSGNTYDNVAGDSGSSLLFFEYDNGWYIGSIVGPSFGGGRIPESFDFLDGELLTCETTGPEFSQVILRDLEIEQAWNKTLSGFWFTSLIADPNGGFWATRSNAAGNIYHYDSSGTVDITTAIGGVGSPIVHAADANGCVVQKGGSVYFFNAAGTQTASAAGGATALLYNHTLSGNYYVTGGWPTQPLQVINRTDGTKTTYARSHTCVSCDGTNVWGASSAVTDLSGEVYKYDLAGNEITDANWPAQMPVTPGSNLAAIGTLGVHSGDLWVGVANATEAPTTISGFPRVLYRVIDSGDASLVREIEFAQEQGVTRQRNGVCDFDVVAGDTITMKYHGDFEILQDPGDSKYYLYSLFQPGIDGSKGIGTAASYSSTDDAFYCANDAGEYHRLNVQSKGIVWTADIDAGTDKINACRIGAGNTAYYVAPRKEIGDDGDTPPRPLGFIMQLDTSGTELWSCEEIGLANDYAIVENGSHIYVGHTIIQTQIP